MTTPNEIKLPTVGQLIEELNDCIIEPAEWEWCVVCSTPNGSNWYLEDVEEALELDAEGDLCISFTPGEYDRTDYYTLEMLLDALKAYPQQARVYLTAQGKLLTWEDGLTWNEDDEEVGFEGIVFGTYEEPSEEPSKNHNPQPQKQSSKTLQRIVLIAFTLLLLYASFYNVRAIITHTGAMWKNIMWSTACIFLTIINSLTLYFDFQEK